MPANLRNPRQAGWRVLAGKGAVLPILLFFRAAFAQDPFPGNPPLVARWAFEPWVWEDNTNTRTSTESLVNGYKSRNIPVGAVIIDSPWETYLNNGVFDASRYPGAQAMIGNFHAQGVKVVVWITGFVDTDDPNHAAVKSNGYGVGNGADLTWWKGTGIHIDFTKAAAKTWWHSVLDKALDLGVDGWKVDQSADYVPDPTPTSIGNIPRQDFKKYYYADLFDYTTGRNPAAITTARAFASSQGGIGASVSKVSVAWNGDFGGDFGTGGLPLQVHDVYVAALRGYGCPGVEVGGYFGANPTKNSLIRYAQFAALTPFMENGGSNGGTAQHLPWYWDTATVNIYRYFATLHSELAPYSFSLAVDAHLAGTSAIRSADTTKHQHLLGESILVSTLTSDVQSKSVSFPAGAAWLDYWNDTVRYAGGTTAAYAVPLDRYPIFIKAGAILPLNVKNDVTGHGDSASAGKTTLLIYPQGQSRFVFHRALGDGVAYADAAIDVDATAGTIKVTSDSTVGYRFRIKSVAKPSSVAGADAWSYDAARDFIVADKKGSAFTISLAYASDAVAKPKARGRLANDRNGTKAFDAQGRRDPSQGNSAHRRIGFGIPGKP